MRVRYVVSAAPVGVAVALFHAFLWPWDLLVFLIPVAVAMLSHRREFGSALLLYGFVATVLVCGLGVYALSGVRQLWLPVPALVGLGVVAVVLGTAWVMVMRRKGSARTPANTM
jgi:hypothetical protein